MMSSIKTTFFIATVFFLTACKTIPTTPDEVPIPETEHTTPNAADSTAQDTSSQNPSNIKSEQNHSAQKETTSANASANLTSEEHTQQLDQQLDERFADFDRLLLREREFLSEEQKEQGDPQNNGSTGATGGEGLDSFEGLDGFDDIPTSSSSSENGNNDTQQATGQNSYPSTNTNINTPPDLVNSKGDDVIARQLREAAQKEKDPVLREKLWDEYRKYKSGI
ncbi:MAG: hypothetical protein DHS20C09_08620 [marine bacterium B5-7]|nr:MAG: hypothetical protein DHS20C09_08620 [marine bacterium B5-7]